jgi:hypothetical protein
LDLNDYYLVTVDNKVALYDDQTLHNALKLSTSSDQSKLLEITLCRRNKSNLPLGNIKILHLLLSARPLIFYCLLKDDLHLRRNSNYSLPPVAAPNVPKIIHLQNNSSAIFSPPVTATENVPIIKPTVLRWTPAILSTNDNNTNTATTNNIRRYSSISQDDHSIDCRKDSGISLDEPHHHHYRKKQRVMSSDHPRKLPDPSSSPLLLPLIRNNSISLHPLEIRRPSTAPPSCSPPNSPFPPSRRPSQQQNINYIPPTLPAISSITSPTHHQQILDPQLAPIHSLTSKSSLYHHSHPPAPIAIIHKQHQPITTTNKRTRSPNTAFANSNPSNTNITNNSSNIFHCEHVTAENGKICGQTFRRSYDLSRHQTIHLENRPFCYCNQCGKKFTRMDALRRHERVQGHNNNNPSKMHRASATATMMMTMPPQQRKTSV